MAPSSEGAPFQGTSKMLFEVLAAIVYFGPVALLVGIALVIRGRYA